MRIERSQVIAILEGDEEIVVQLRESGVVCDDVELSPEEVEECVIAHTLVRDLDVNWPGVEVILRMRRELLEARQQLNTLAAELRRRGGDR